MNLSCSALAHSSSLRCSITPPGAEPALLTRMSMRPSAACASLTNLSTSAALVISAEMATILRPLSLAISAAAASSGSLRRAQMATSTPSRAKVRVTALPMPSLPPVTIAFLPCIPRSMAVPLLLFVSEPRHQLARIVVQDLRGLHIGEARLAHRTDRVEIGGRKGIIAPEQHALDAHRLGKPAQMHRAVQDGVVMEAPDIGGRAERRDIALRRAVHARMHAIEAPDEIGKRAAAVGKDDAQIG